MKNASVAIILFAACITAAALSVGSISLYQRFHETNGRRAVQTAINHELIRSDAHQRASLRLILCLAERTTIASKQGTVAQKQQALDFYGKALALIHAAPCIAPKK